MDRRRIIDENLRFLLMEVTKQVEHTQGLLDDSEAGDTSRIKRRDDHIDHLRGLIENEIFAYLGRQGDLDKRETDYLRSVSLVATNLERIGDHAVNIASQMEHFTDPSFIRRYDRAPFLETIFDALQRVLPATRRRDIEEAKAICEAEIRLDELYSDRIELILAEMALGREVGDLVTSLFIFHYLERIGDCLMNIGEAVLFANLGERLRYEEYLALRDVVSAVRPKEEPLSEVDIEGIWSTRSGCRIGRLVEANGRDGEADKIIYKEGNRAKIGAEKAGIERWAEAAPGIPPRIMEYRDDEDHAALLVEYLNGGTLQDLILDGRGQVLIRALDRLTEAMGSVWRATRRDAPVSAGFLAELIGRMDDVIRMHPEVRDRGAQIGARRIPDLPSLVAANMELDNVLEAPFSVLVHGDFNVDNVIFNVENDRIHLIDLHRSRWTDYVADGSVMLVSIFRLPVFDEEVRGLMNQASGVVYRFLRGFALEHGDGTFHARLALGLVRSFATSSRFEPTRSFAHELLSRARYLLERLAGHGDAPWTAFEMPEDVLYY